MKDSTKLFKNMSLIGVGLCAACCLLPVTALISGVAGLTMLTMLKWVSMAVITVSALLLLIHYVKRFRARSCDVNCSCATKQSKEHACK
jgi:hypothetical protein